MKMTIVIRLQLNNLQTNNYEVQMTDVRRTM